MSQYGEPLRYVRDIDGPKLFGHASDGECLFAEICDGDIDTDVIMARVVACVNALAGVPHPERLPGLLAALKAESDAMKRCDEGPSAFAEGEDERLHHVLRNRLLDATIVRVRAYRAMMGETP